MIYQDEQVRLHKTNSVNSVNKEACLNVELQTQRKKFPFPAVSDVVDQRIVFEHERATSTKFRLILTINPYCTNILFNAVTEIVQNEGTRDVGKLLIVDKKNTYNEVVTGDKILGVTKPNNYDMVRNTEYANGSTPFQYHCGFDIFNNHKLRNLSFKPVIPAKNTIDDDRKIYNTIEDYLRDRTGEKVTLRRRTSINVIDQSKKRKLYLKDDILSFPDSIVANLQEVNGWFGFRNTSAIPTREVPIDNKVGKPIKNSKVFNENKVGCEFIEMYPDSTLYSFKPKYNFFQNREEYNWDICLTYPYEKTTKNNEGDVFELIQHGEVNALYLTDYELTIGTSGEEIVLFRSLIKHNLKIGDSIALYYLMGTSGEFKRIGNQTFRVKNIGNLSGDNVDYYFYVDNIVEHLYEPILKSEYEKIYTKFKKKIDDYEKSGKDTSELYQKITNEKDEVKNSLLKNKEKFNLHFRFAKISGGMECQYYVRKFKKLPNLRKIKRELTKEICENKEEFEKYIKENCLNKDKKMLQFSKEIYPLAFAKTIYNDQISQVTFTDTIDISEIRDHLGMPITTIYATIIKRNKGHELWYKKEPKFKTEKEESNEEKLNDNNNKIRAEITQVLENIEYSHCFGPVSCGFTMHSEKNDSAVLVDRKTCGDVTTITNDVNSSESNPIETNITIDNDEFYGDIVEFDRYTLSETVLSDVCFRFNTLQRETDFSQLGEGYLDYGEFKYDEITSDDYDRDGFKLETAELKNATIRKEGYYYKAHYPIYLRDVGRMIQASNQRLLIKKASVIQAGGLKMIVTTKNRSGAIAGDELILKSENYTAYLIVDNVLSQTTFIMSFQKTNNESANIPKPNINNIVLGLNGGTYKLLFKNTSIPSYAVEVSDNLFVWREVLNSGDVNSKNIKEYPFANNHFYINEGINFFLKRQDPYGYNGLLNKDLFPCDIYNRPPKTPIYTYKDDSNAIC